MTTERKSITIVLPVYNEERAVRESVYTLHAFLQFHDEYDWKVIIADNASIDGTREISETLAKELDEVHYHHIPRKGRGIALRTVWEAADTDYVGYMDIDLSTSLKALITAINMLDEGHDLAVGNRLDKRSGVRRCLKREVVSRCFNITIRLMLNTRFKDAHCGFKWLRTDVAKKLVPYIEDNEWFFDTELLFYAEKLGHSIAELPVMWTEDLDTKAKIFKDASDDLKGLWRLRFHNNLPKS